MPNPHCLLCLVWDELNVILFYGSNQWKYLSTWSTCATLPTSSTSATWWGSKGSRSSKGRWGELLWLDRTEYGWRGTARSGVLENSSLWKTKAFTNISHYVYLEYFLVATFVSLYLCYHLSQKPGRSESPWKYSSVEAYVGWLCWVVMHPRKCHQLRYMYSLLQLSE